jgi:transposase
MSYIQGQSRTQRSLFPEAIDELIEEHSAVRVIDAFVSSLDLQALQFGRAVPAQTGRPGYDPADMLKLYVYGYLNQIRTTRRLEREAQRNVELLWLLNRLRPDFKTIADFRKNNARAIVGCCRAFSLFCREQGLFAGQLVAIDGSKFQAVASRKQVWSKERLQKVSQAIDRKIKDYLGQLDSADAKEPAHAVEDTQAALAALAEQKAKLQQIAQQLEDSEGSTLVASEPQAKTMRLPQAKLAPAYNVQTAVDDKHALIACFEVTTEAGDREQLSAMAENAKAALDAQHLTVLADAGYDNAEQCAKCEAAGIEPVVPAQARVNPEGEQYFHKDQFQYEAEHDRFRCPAGESLYPQRTDHARQRVLYSTRACGGCALRSSCTSASRRWVQRLIHAEAGQRANQRAKSNPALMRKRSALVEHPFAGLKRIIPRFVLRGVHKVSAEIALAVTAYNLKRAMNILGAHKLREAWA